MMKLHHERAGCAPRPHAAGFTLVEMLVVLVLVGMVAAIVMGTLGAVVDARTRAAGAIERATDAQLAEAWVRQPLDGLLPDYDDRPHRFSGERRRLSGLTARALLSPTAGPVPFSMTLAYEPSRDTTTLVYAETIAEREQTMVIDSWPGNRGAFFYRGESGAWLAAWPPRRMPGGLPPPQIPHLVRLDRAIEEGIASLLVAPKQNAERNKRVIDLERELRAAPIQPMLEPAPADAGAMNGPFDASTAP